MYDFFPWGKFMPQAILGLQRMTQNVHQSPNKVTKNKHNPLGRDNLPSRIRFNSK